MGPRGGARLLPHGIVAQADRLLGGDDGAGGGAARHAAKRVHARAAAEHDETAWDAFAEALNDDFDTPAALAVLHDWASTGQLDLLRRGLGIFGLESLAERDEAPAEVLAARRAPSALRGPSATSSPPTACGTSSPRSAGRCATSLTAATSSFVTPDLVYGRRAVREALRGNRARCSRSGRRSGRSRPSPGSPRRRPKAKAGPRALRAGRYARSPGRPRARRAVPLRRRLRARCGRAAAARGARPGHRPA